MFGKSYRILIHLLFYTFCFNSFEITEGLKCYDCFWDSKPEETLKENNKKLEELAQIKDRKFPVAEYYIDIPERRPPKEDEIKSKCTKKQCQSKDNSCLKWTFESNNPINITYMCVGNPQKRKGCFRKEIKTTDMKGVFIEACLCDSEFCNTASRTDIRTYILYSLFLMLFIRFYIIKL